MGWFPDRGGSTLAHKEPGVTAELIHRAAKVFYEADPVLIPNKRKGFHETMRWEELPQDVRDDFINRMGAALRAIA